MVEEALEKKLVEVAPPLKVAAPLTVSAPERVAPASDAVPLAVSVLNVAPFVALRFPPIVVEPVVVSVLRDERPETLREVEVALVVVAFVAVTPWSDDAPSTVSDPFALSAPPTVRSEERVVEPVTASVPVVVAPVVVSPPLNASCVVVAPAGNG